MQRRPKKGCTTKHHGWWVLRYRETVGVEGRIETVRRAVRLAQVNAQYKTKASVRLLADQHLQSMNQSPCVSPLNVTKIGDFVVRAYLPYVQQQKRPSTHRGYVQMWNRYLRHRCESMWLREVKTYHVQAWLNEIAREPQMHHGREQTLSKTTLAHVKNFLSGVFRHAAQQGYFDQANPVKLTEIPAFAPKGREGRAYTLEEVDQMVRLLAEPAATVVMTAAHTGFRLGELQGLTWQDYTRPGEPGELGSISVNRSVWRGRIGDPKTHKSRAPVPVTPQLAKRLGEFRRSVGDPIGGPIFANGAGKPMDLNALYYRHMKDALEVAKIEWHGWHGFRRGLASNLNRLGVDDSVIQTILRHSDVSLTQRCYIKTTPPDAVAAMLHFSQLLHQMQALESDRPSSTGAKQIAIQ
jgi:integrase